MQTPPALKGLFATLTLVATSAFDSKGFVSSTGSDGAIDGTNVWIGAKGGGRWSYEPSWYARSTNGYSAARLFELNPVVDLSRLLPGAVMRCDYPAPVHAEGIILPDAHAVGIRMLDADLGLGAVPLAHDGGAGLFVSVDAGGMLSMQSSQTMCGLSGDGAGGGIAFADDATLALDSGSVKTAAVYRARMSGGTFEKKGAGHKLTMTGILELKALEVSAGILEIAPDNAPVPEPVGLWTLDGDVPAEVDTVVHAEPDGRVTKGIQSKGTAAYRPVPRGTLASSLPANGSFTVSARVGALKDAGTFLMVGDGSDSRTVRFRREGERILALIGQITNDFASVIASTNVSAANWMQLTVAYDAAAQKLSFYRDSMPTGSTNVVVRLNPQDVVFGAGGLSSSTGVANSFKRGCQMDDIRIFPSALSAEQVATVARMVRVGAEAPPLPADCIVTIASGAILRIQSGDVSVAEIKGGGMLEIASGASFSAARSSAFSGTVVGQGAYNGRQRVWADVAGRLGLAGQPDGFSVYPQAILNDSPWTRVDSQGGYLADEAGARVFTIGDPVLFDGALSVKSVSTNGAVAADAAWTFTPPADVADVRQICVVFQLPPDAYTGGEVVFDGGTKTVVWPETTPADAALATVANPRTMSLVDAGGSETMRIEFLGDVKVRVQDDRGKASGAFIVRAYIEPETGGVFPAQSARGISMRLFFPGAAEVTDIPGYQIHMGERWIPLEPYRDILPGSALDMSAVCGMDAPAGRHGKVVVRGGHFEFEDMPGVPQRFIGAQISDTATSNIRQAEADRLADQIARRGYNAVRLHHQDKVLVLSSDPGGTNLNTYAMGRFDYLVGACVSRGLYITTDLYASRTAVQWAAVGFPERSGTVSSDDFKYLVMVNDAVKRNFKDFARNFLLHRNPYTGRSLAEEPALIGLSVVNESQKSLFATPSRLVAEHPVWGEKWSEWIARKKQSSGVWADVSETPPSSVTGSGATGYAFAAFLAETERAFAREMRTFIRDELGCAAPLTALNGASDSRACFEVARGEYDYVDWHAYVDHPTFLGERWKLPATLKNKNTLRFGGRGVLERAWMRLADRPVTATEWQFAAPGEYRAAGGLLMGAFAAAQAYDGIWRFSWAESVGAATNAYQKAVGFFESTGDPISLESERAAVCLYRRGDLAENTREYLNQINPLLLNKPQEALVKSMNSSEGTQWAAWYAKIGSVLSTNAFVNGEISAGLWPGPSTNNKAVVMRHLGLANVNGDLPPAADGQVVVRMNSGYFAVNTENTSGGFAEDGTIDGGALTATISGGPAAIWASTLDGKGFAASKRILVVHLTDVVNSGIRFADEERTTLLGWGSLPHLMRDGRADVSLRVGEGGFRVHSLSRDGSRRDAVPFSLHDGRLRFTADISANPAAATCLYEIERRDPPLVISLK